MTPRRPGVPEMVVAARHGSTSWSRSGRHTGRTDVPLDAGGIADAEALGGRLAAVGPGVVFSSPLVRALETCKIAGFADVAEIDPDLVEWDYGDYEGLTTAEIRATRPGWQLFADGCPGGEQLVDVVARVDAFLGRLATRSDGANERVAVFAHGHLLRTLAVRWIGLDGSAGAHFALDAGRFGLLGWDHETPALRGWNA